MAQAGKQIVGDPVIAPSKTSSEEDFNFHVGNWKIHNKYLKTRLKRSDEWIDFESTCETHTVLNGFGNINSYRFQKNALPFDEGLVLRLFDPRSKLWTINWADSNSVALDIPVIGSFDSKVGTFYSNDTFGGEPIVVRAIYDATDTDTVIWSQAFSQDEGKTFETNWIMTKHRQNSQKKK